MGIMMVSVAGSGVAKRFETASLVAQLLPQSNVTPCRRNSQNCSQTGRSRPSCERMAATGCGVANKPARIPAGSPPNHLKRKNTSSMTPNSVGTICRILRTAYASMCRRARENAFFAKADYACCPAIMKTLSGRIIAVVVPCLLHQAPVEADAPAPQKVLRYAFRVAERSEERRVGK